MLSVVLVQFRFSRYLKPRTFCVKNMEPKVNLRQDPAYQKLQEYYNKNADKINIQQLFQQDAERFNKYR